MTEWAIAPLLSSLLVAVLCLLLYSRPKWQLGAHLSGAVLYLLFSVKLSYLVFQGGSLSYYLGSHVSGVAIRFYLDYFSVLMLVVSALVVLATACYSVGDSSIRKPAVFYPAMWFLVAGVSGAFMTADLFNLYVWFEVMIIASIVMMTLSYEQNRLHGTLHYIALNLLATLIMLLAIAGLYGLSGTLDMAVMAKNLDGSKAIVQIFLALLLMAFAMKSALFPFYFWLPASYHLSSVAAGGIFAGLLTKVGVYAIIRSSLLFLTPSSPILLWILVLSAVSMLAGVFGAMQDFHIRRILSFHIISQIGYMTLALAIGTPLAISAALFYIIHHILVKTNLFLIAGICSRYHRDNDLRAMGGLYQYKPLLAVLFCISAFSLAGVPPLSGFWAKYLVLQAAFSAHFWWSALVILVAGFFTLYSMMKIWRYAFWEENRDTLTRIPMQQSFLSYGAVIMLSMLTLYISFFPQSLYTAAQKAGDSLIATHCFYHQNEGSPLCHE
ncbi:MAG: Na+/H+ antiporter subunit D [Legionellaceae bacterium]|nr:Na+/H+ antiporter subunit D [Legionellaceae bacterium]